MRWAAYALVALMVPQADPGGIDQIPQCGPGSPYDLVTCLAFETSRTASYEAEEAYHTALDAVGDAVAPSGPYLDLLVCTLREYLGSFGSGGPDC